MSYRVDQVDDISQLLEMMRSEHAREGQGVSPTQVEQQDNQAPNSRQIAHPTKVDPERQMTDNMRHGGSTIEEKIALGSDPNTVFATSETAQHSHGNLPRGQHFGVGLGRGQPNENPPPPSSDPLAGLDPFEIHGANGAFVDVVVNPENDRLARAHGEFHQKLSENKIVGKQTDVEEEYFDAAEEARMREEFFPEEVVSGPTGVWDTTGLPGEKQVTATMVNPLDERVKKG